MRCFSVGFGRFGGKGGRMRNKVQCSSCANQGNKFPKKKLRPILKYYYNETILSSHAKARYSHLILQPPPPLFSFQHSANKPPKLSLESIYPLQLLHQGHILLLRSRGLHTIINDFFPCVEFVFLLVKNSTLALRAHCRTNERRDGEDGRNFMVSGIR